MQLKKRDILNFFPSSVQIIISNLYLKFHQFIRGKIVKRSFKSIQQVKFNEKSFNVSVGTAKQNMSDIPNNGHYEPWLTKYLCIASNFYGSNKDAIDIGANVGVISLILGVLQNKGTVFAFEPLSIMYEHLNKNLKSNHVSNVISEKLIISNTSNSFLKINTLKGNSTGGSFVSKKKDSRKLSVSESVKTSTLDSFFKDISNSLDIKIIKIDVECWEEYVLEGAHETIKNHQPITFIEFNVQNRSLQIEKHGIHQFEQMKQLFKYIFLIDRISHKLIPTTTYSDLRGAILTGHFVEDLICFNDIDFLKHIEPYIQKKIFTCYHASRVVISENQKAEVISLIHYPDNWCYGHDFFLYVNSETPKTLRLIFTNDGPHFSNLIIICYGNKYEEISISKNPVIREYNFEANTSSSIYVFTEKTFHAKNFFSLSDPRVLGIKIEIEEL